MKVAVSNVAFWLSATTTTLLCVSGTSARNTNININNNNNIRKHDEFQRGMLEMTDCLNDLDCGTTGEYYCAGETCLLHGSCNTMMDCMNPSNDHNSAQQQADACMSGSGFWDCQQSSCICIDDQGPCPNGRDQVNCVAEPCQVTPRCPNRDTTDDIIAVSCVNSYCGECQAIQFDAAGNHVCGPDDENDGPVLDGSGPVIPVVGGGEGTSCVQDSDCTMGGDTTTSTTRSGMSTNAELYCSKEGICLPFAYCRTHEDCENPSNFYMKIECIGVLYCDDTSFMCSVECCEGSECDAFLEEQGITLPTTKGDEDGNDKDDSKGGDGGDGGDDTESAASSTRKALLLVGGATMMLFCMI